MSRWEKFALITLLCVCFLDLAYFSNKAYIALTNPAPAYGGQYNEGILGQPRFINPLLATTNADQSLVRLVYSGLYTYDDQGNVIPDLAASMPEISEDQKQYTIHLRENALWHNGRPVTADDVVFTVHTLQDATFGSPLRGLWLNTEVTKNGDHTVIFSNRDISAPFIHNLTLPILPEHVWSNVTASNFVLSNLNLEAIGSGPFVVREINKRSNGSISEIRLESFSNFYNNKPYLDAITLSFYNSYEELVSAMHAKKIDGFGYVSLDTTLQIDTEKNDITIRKMPLPQYQAAFFNLKQPVLADKNVRLALANATNTQALLASVFDNTGLPITGPILPQQLHVETEAKTQITDIATASSLLDQAGWKVNEAGVRAKGNTPLELTITTNDFPQNAHTAEKIAEEWRKLNMTVKLSIVPTKDLTDTILKNRQFDVLLFALKLGADPDPFIFWHSSQIKDPGLNLTGFSNAQADKLISEARSTTDKQVRLEAYKQFQSIVTTETPAIFLNQTAFIYAVSNKIHNISTEAIFDPSLRFNTVQKWYEQEKRVWK